MVFKCRRPGEILGNVLQDAQGNVTGGRVFGWEAEQGISCLEMLDGKLEVADNHTMWSMLCHVYPPSHPFNRSGNRHYIDVGSHPERCTAEHNTVRGIVRDFFFGEGEMDRRARAATRYFKEAKQRDVYLKVWGGNTTGGETYAGHANYQIWLPIDTAISDDRMSIEDFMYPLAPFLATCSIVLGAGDLVWDGDGLHMNVSVRASRIWDAFSCSTTRSRSLVNLRDEPHAGDGSSRLHVISFDAPIRPRTKARIHSLMVVLLTMREQGKLKGLRLSGEELVQVTQTVTRNPEYKFSLECGNKSAFDIQRTYAQEALEFVTGRVGLEQFAPWVEDYMRCLDLIAEHGYNAEALSDELDWALTWESVQELVRAGHTSRTKLFGRQLELHLHTGRDTRRMRAAAADPWFERFGLHELPEILEPPRTRAWARGAVIAAAQELRLDFNADWEIVVVNGESIHLPKPGSPKLPFQAQNLVRQAGLEHLLV